MTGNRLPDSDHVVRHVGFTDFADLEAGILNCSAFQLGSNEPGLSVNWLECFVGQDKSRQLQEVRNHIQRRLGPNGRFAELNVGFTLNHIGDNLPDLEFVKSPSLPRGEYPADPSHSEVLGLPPWESLESEFIGDLIVECVTNLHPTVPQPG